ncbi:HdeD family acid-resistance protein [Acuticoccus sp.]|uniref:HdeD family acid-resistance protein n=1 Tax=Acuticoccus sp. TaxID=1904378 RepID=UPI003B52B098
MSSTDTGVLRDPLYGAMTLNWKWMLALGLLMAVLGIIGLGMTYALTIVGVLWFGVLAIVGGIAQVIDAFKYKGWRGFAAHLLMGLLYIGAGVVLIVLPVQSAWWLTLLIGAVFIITGVLRLVTAFQMRGGGSGSVWLGLTGVISLVLGAMIFAVVDLPDTEALATLEGAEGWFLEWGWVIGLFIAIEFIVHGASLVALSFTARNRGNAATAEEARRGEAPQSV